MSLRQTFEFEFVEFVPKVLEPGKLYISVEYRTAVHSCFCGCGMKVVTPIRPHEWQLTYDGETVTLYPSVGNWSFPCQSHYWLKRNGVVWAARMSPSEIARVRAHDQMAHDARQGSQPPAPETPPAQSIPLEKGFWAAVKRWLS